LFSVKIAREDLRVKPRLKLKASRRHKDLKNDYQRRPKHKKKNEE